MLSQSEFITMSIDLNLFFLRIMKEHSLFLELAFTPKDSRMSMEAGEFRKGFDELLAEAVDLAHGTVSRNAVESQQFVTPYTVDAENLTNFYTGVPINTRLTQEELNLRGAGGMSPVSNLERAVEMLDRKAYRLTMSLAEFKTRLLANVRSCRMFTLNYPLLIEHILREARLFMRSLVILVERNATMTPSELAGQEAFWNRQMAEHAKFIAGLLDPSEDSLIDTARLFGREFDALTAESRQALEQSTGIEKSTADSIAATKRLKEFKTAGTQGILGCKIQSIIVPLLADHVLREANHYLCVMGVCNQR